MRHGCQVLHLQGAQGWKIFWQTLPPQISPFSQGTCSRTGCVHQNPVKAALRNKLGVLLQQVLELTGHGADHVGHTLLACSCFQQLQSGCFGVQRQDGTLDRHACARYPQSTFNLPLPRQLLLKLMLLVTSITVVHEAGLTVFCIDQAMVPKNWTEMALLSDFRPLEKQGCGNLTHAHLAGLQCMTSCSRCGMQQLPCSRLCGFS